MARSRLPLRAISVFETVARLGSFKAAADELHLTPSAVSHQIRALEDELGVGLFLRESRGVKLAPAGTEYAERLHGLLDGVRIATDEVASRGRRQATTGIVRIMTPPSLATHWLMPRLPAFLDAHPGIDIRVIAIRTADGNADDFDITIAYGNPARIKGLARPWLEETYRPYCAPSLLAGAASIGARELLAKPLIRSRYNDISWNDWFAQRGIGFDPRAVNHLQIDPSYVAIEAAVKGVGVVLESGILTHEHVQNGRLVAPVTEQERPAVSYWLLPLRSDARRPARIAYDWLLDQGNCKH
jgi:LysR family transcriptional regulator, glycine cleavage system transcriptional activator